MIADKTMPWPVWILSMLLGVAAAICVEIKAYGNATFFAAGLLVNLTNVLHVAIREGATVTVATVTEKDGGDSDGKK